MSVSYFYQLKFNRFHYFWFTTYPDMSLTHADVVQVSRNRWVLIYTPTAHQGVKAVESTSPSICLLTTGVLTKKQLLEGSTDMLLLSCMLKEMKRTSASHEI